MRLMSVGLAVLAGLVSMGAIAGAAYSAGKKAAPELTRIYAGSFPIAQSVKVPPGSTLVYVSGLTPDIVAGQPNDTAAQTASVIKKIQAALQAQGLDLKDVTMMHVYLVGDPTKGGVMDFAGMMSSYTQYFGTADQPNKPARTTVQVAALANPAFKVEIDVVAARAN